MRNTRCQWNLFPIYDHTGLAHHLEQMAAKGWMVEGHCLQGLRYRRTEPRAVHFAVTYFPQASAFDPVPSEGEETFQDFCGAAGWTLALSMAQMQIFYSEAESPVPIETDAAVQVDTIHRAMKRNFLLSQGVLLAVAILQLVFFGYRMATDPIELLSATINLFVAANWLLVLVLDTTEVITYLSWHRRAKRAAEADGSFVPTRSHPAFQAAALAVLALWLLTLVFSLNSGREMLFGGMSVLYLFLVLALVSLFTALLKRKKVSAGVNRIATITLSFLLSMGLMGGVVALSLWIGQSGWLNEHSPAGTYTYRGWTQKIYHDPLPLTVQDLQDTAYPGYSTTLSRNTSFLLTYTVASQRPRMDALEEPELVYEITQVKVPFLYTLCKNNLVHRYDSWNEDIPPEYWDEYRLEETPAWGAEAVYRRYSSGEPWDRYLVCWPDRLVEITFGWTPTAEQIALAAEKLQTA